MLTLLSSLLGFGTSFIPKLLDFMQDKSDKAQELKIMALQIEREEKMLAVKAEMMDAANETQRDLALLEHDAQTAKNASTWVHNLRSSVRPIITYLFFVLFFFAEGVAAYVVLRDGGDISLVASTLWSEETSSIFAAIISFWFGSRAIKR